jgi:hypothetical protein
MGNTSMTGRAGWLVSVAVTVRTTPTSGPVLGPGLALGVPVVGGGDAEALAVERSDAEGKLIWLERLSSLGASDQRVQRFSEVVRLDRAERIAQRGVRHAPVDAEQAPDGRAHALAQRLDLSEALGSGKHPADDASEQCSEVPALAPLVAPIGDLVEPDPSSRCTGASSHRLT